MRFVADENIDRLLVDDLRRKGHSVIHIVESHVGLSDRDVAKLAWDSDSIIVTHDKGFGDLLLKQRLLSRGIVILRLEALPRAAALRVAANALDRTGKQLIGAITVVQPGFIRSRPMR